MTITKSRVHFTVEAVSSMMRVLKGEGKEERLRSNEVRCLAFF